MSFLLVLSRAALVATKPHVARNFLPIQQSSRGVIKRRFVADPVKVPNDQASAATVARKAAEKPLAADVGRTVEVSSASEPSKLGNGPAQVATADAAEANSAKPDPKIPDVPSTSLGMEDPDANDPLKWKKFAFKYAGAVLLFMISYKTLHWYVDRLEADGKRQRAEVEENKEILREISSPRASTPLAASSSITPAASAAPTVGADLGSSQGHPRNQSAAAAIQDESLPALRIFDQVKEEEPHVVSELEELYVYRVELETKLRDLRADPSSKENGAQQREIKSELKELENEIMVLEAQELKKGKS